MSRIVSPVPIQILIEYNEITNQAALKLSKDLPFPMVCAIFCQLMLQMVQDGMRQMGASTPGPTPGPTAPGGNHGAS